MSNLPLPDLPGGSAIKNLQHASNLTNKEVEADGDCVRRAVQQATYYNAHQGRAPSLVGSRTVRCLQELVKRCTQEFAEKAVESNKEAAAAFAEEILDEANPRTTALSTHLQCQQKR